MGGPKHITLFITTQAVMQSGGGRYPLLKNCFIRFVKASQSNGCG